MGSFCWLPPTPKEKKFIRNWYFIALWNTAAMKQLMRASKEAFLPTLLPAMLQPCSQSPSLHPPAFPVEQHPRGSMPSSPSVWDRLFHPVAGSPCPQGRVPVHRTSANPSPLTSDNLNYRYIWSPRLHSLSQAVLLCSWARLDAAVFSHALNPTYFSVKYPRVFFES